MREARRNHLAGERKRSQQVESFPWGGSHVGMDESPEIVGENVGVYSSHHKICINMNVLGF